MAAPRSASVISSLSWIFRLAWYSLAELWLRRQIQGCRFPTSNWFSRAFRTVPSYRGQFSRLAARNHETLWDAGFEVSHGPTKVAVDLRVPVRVSPLALFVTPAGVPILTVSQTNRDRSRVVFECLVMHLVPEVTERIEQLADSTTVSEALAALDSADDVGSQPAAGIK